MVQIVDEAKLVHNPDTKKYEWTIGFYSGDKSGSKKVRFFMMKDRSIFSIWPKIFAVVPPGATIVTDSYVAYFNLFRMNGYIC